MPRPYHQDDSPIHTDAYEPRLTFEGCVVGVGIAFWSVVAIAAIVRGLWWLCS